MVHQAHPVNPLAESVYAGGEPVAAKLAQHFLGAMRAPDEAEGEPRNERGEAVGGFEQGCFQMRRLWACVRHFQAEEPGGR